MKRFALITSLALSALIIFTGCGRQNYKKDDLASTHTIGAKETMAATVPSSESLKINSDSGENSGSSHEEPEPGENSSKSSSLQTGKNVSVSLHTYKDGNISIEYPVISNLSDSSVQEKVNGLLSSHAKEIVGAWSVNGAADTLSVKCRVVSAGRKRISAVYTGVYSPEGASYPTNVFYTNTVDTVFGKDIGLNDYADPYTLAGYVLSDDCKFHDVEPEVEKELRTLKNGTGIQEYTDLFRNADFPYKGDGSNPETLKFPQIFSYEDHGTIYTALPVSHALGDYAIIEYTPDTK